MANILQTATPHCSFCGKEKAEVKRLIEGADDVYICDECVLLGAEILAEEGLAEAGKPVKNAALPPQQIPNPKAHRFLKN